MFHNFQFPTKKLDIMQWQSQKRKFPCDSLELLADVLITIIAQFLGFECQRTMRLVNKRCRKVAVECLRKGCEPNVIEIYKDKWRVAIYSTDNDPTFQNNSRIFRETSHYNWNWTLMLCFDNFNENNLNFNSDDLNFINQALDSRMSFLGQH